MLSGFPCWGLAQTRIPVSHGHNKVPCGVSAGMFKGGRRAPVGLHACREPGSLLGSWHGTPAAAPASVPCPHCSTVRAAQPSCARSPRQSRTRQGFSSPTPGWPVPSHSARADPTSAQSSAQAPDGAKGWCRGTLGQAPTPQRRGQNSKFSSLLE